MCEERRMGHEVDVGGWVDVGGKFRRAQSPRANSTPSALCCALVSVATLSVSTSAAALETRTYVVHRFVHAANSHDGDCGPKGPNEDADKLYARYLAEFGKSPAEVQRLINGWISGGPEGREVQQLMVNRGRINGEPVNAYTHPAAVKDPQLRTVISREGYGFNLDGKVSPEDFVDAETGEKGVDHNMFRAVGCNQGFRGTPGAEGAYWAYNLQLTGSEPAWLISITGEDLSRDGEVTITINRSYEHLKLMANGEPVPYTTYRIDPDARSQNVFRARIKDNLLTLVEPANFRIQWNPLAMPELVLTQARLRMKLKPDGKLEAIIGGYQPWESIYWGVAEGGYAKEEMVVGDVPGLYYTLRKLADADPDPQTGMNRAISAAYHFLGVPAFHATVPKTGKSPAQIVRR